MILAIYFILGTIVGSFLNVVGLRYISGRTVGGRSSCPNCNTELEVLDLVPIFSYIFLRGKCKHCGERISVQYPLIEVLTGLVFVLLYHLYGLGLASILLAAISCLYIAIIIVDSREKIIPNKFIYPAIALSVVFRLVIGGSLLDWLTGPILFALFTLGWYLTKGRGLGFADGKLALSIGLILGGEQGVSAVVLAFWLGTAAVLPVMFYGMIFKKNRLTMKSEIPFGPFLILGAWVSLLFHLDIFHLALFQ